MSQDLEIIKELEEEIGFDLKKKDKIEWNDKACYQIDHKQKVIGLSLYEAGLKQFPETITKLVNLNVLILRSNQLTIIIPEIGNLVNLQTLNLRNNQLANLIPEIDQIVSLEILNLSYNQLETLIPEISKLVNLQHLDLSKNKLTTLIPEIGQLVNLNLLNLSNNQLTTLIPEIGKLEKLTKLDLNKNQLKDLVPEIGQLVKLKILNLQYNQLIALNPEIGKLVNLQHLDLSKNKLKTLIPEIICQLVNLNILDLSGNPLKLPPIEIVDKGVKGIFEYLQKISEQEKRTKKDEEITEDRIVNEAKLILVGQGDVGKTCLAERLIYDRFQDQRSTEGIDILKWQINPPTDKKQEIDLNVWDFGGQEIYHATHQFFLTKRSVYIVVWNARKSHDYEFIYYWLHIVEAFGEDSPVILLMSKCKERDDDLNLKDLKDRFPQIVGSYKIDSNDGTGIDELKKIIAKTSWNLPQMNVTWIISWLKTRRELEKIRYEEKKDWIDYNTFLEICEKQKLSKSEIDILDRYLHDLGVIIHFNEPLELRNMVILNPEWATDAVYKILDFKPIRNRQGVLLHKELNQIWDIKKYPINPTTNTYECYFEHHF